MVDGASHLFFSVQLAAAAVDWHLSGEKKIQALWYSWYSSDPRNPRSCAVLAVELSHVFTRSLMNRIVPGNRSREFPLKWHEQFDFRGQLLVLQLI